MIEQSGEFMYLKNYIVNPCNVNTCECHKNVDKICRKNIKKRHSVLCKQTTLVQTYGPIHGQISQCGKYLVYPFQSIKYKIDKLRKEFLPHIQKHTLAGAEDPLVATVDLRSACPPCYAQGHLGSCTSNSILAAFEYLTNLQFRGSRLFHYWCERVEEGHKDFDAGASLATSVHVLTKYGVCPETMWDYDITKFNVEPPAECFTEALNYQAVKYIHLTPTRANLQNALRQNLTINIGIVVFQSFLTLQVAQTGIVPMPQIGEPIIFLHAVEIVGFNEQYWIMRNSWGPGWGLLGYFLLPLEYLDVEHHISSDFWCLTAVTIKGVTFKKQNQNLVVEI